MRYLGLVVVAGMLLLPQAYADKSTSLKSDDQKLSYTFGYQVGANLRVKMPIADKKAFLAALKDALDGKPPKLTEQQMQQVMTDFQSKMQARMKQLSEENTRAGDAYRASNKKKAGVKQTPSGLQYRIIKAGTGKKPKATDTVVVHYRGRFVNGKEFDSSYNRGKPTEFALSGIIPAWQEALPMMKMGAKWEIVAPPELAYGPVGRPGMPPNSTLIFEIELVSIK